MVAEASTFRTTLGFFDRIGVYDVVLPFLLVYTIVFAIFEKTKVLGTETIEGKTYSKKNINSMVAFVMSFMVIASSKLVEIITTVSSQMVILLLLSILFLLLIGSFWKDGEVFLDKESGWYTLFMLIMFVGIVLIFLNAMGWLNIIFGYVGQFWTSSAVSAVVLILVVLLFMWLVTKEPSHKKSSKES